MPDDLRWNWCNLSRNKWVSEVAQLCPTLCDPRDCRLPGSSVHGILQARVLEWGAIAFSNRNKMHNKCNALESARNHPPTPGPWKNCLSQNQFLMPKRLGTAAVVSALLNLLLGSKRNKLRGICEDESWAEAQSHSSPSSFQSLGELWNTKSHAKPHMDEELTSCPAQSVSHEVQTTLCGDSVIFEVSGQWQILGDR